MVLVAALVLIGAASALAVTDFSWTGASGSGLWSDAGNWAGGVSPSGGVGTLTFACPFSGPICATDDDIAGVDANALDLSGFWMGGGGVGGSQPLTLGAGGLNQLNGAAVVSLPVVLGAPQSWGVNTELQVSDVSGAAVPLSIELGTNSQFSVNSGAGVEVGSVTVSGPGTLVLGGGSLDGTDGSSVSVTDGAQMQTAADGSVGPLTLTAGTLSLTGHVPASETDSRALATSVESGSPPTVDVNGGLTLDSASSVVADLGWETDILGPSAVTYLRVGGQVDATGTVNLGDATLTFPLVPEGLGGLTCPSVGSGQVYTLIQTTGQLLGTFAGIADGTLVPVGGNCPDPPIVRINYSSHAVTATIVHGTPAPSWLGAVVSPANPVVNQPVTVTADVGALYGTPTGTVTVTLDPSGAWLPGCRAVPVEWNGSDYTASCRTSLSSVGEQGLPTDFESSSPDVASSSTSLSFPPVVSVGRASSRAVLRASAARVATGASVTYKVTVTPHFAGPTKPSGSIAFLDDGKPIASCARRRLTAGSASSTATCTTSFAAAGSRSITAVYRGDVNFTGSSAAAIRTGVVHGTESAAALKTQLRAIKAGDFARLWNPRGVSLSFQALTAGKLVIRWYLDSPGGHGPQRRASVPQRSLLTTTRLSLKRPGTAKIRLVLSRSARLTLSHRAQAQITATARFTAPGAQPVQSSATFTIKR